jgi:hypothetical protein
MKTTITKTIEISPDELAKIVLEHLKLTPRKTTEVVFRLKTLDNDGDEALEWVFDCAVVTTRDL